MVTKRKFRGRVTPPALNSMLYNEGTREPMGRITDLEVEYNMMGDNTVITYIFLPETGWGT